MSLPHSLRTVVFPRSSAVTTAALIGGGTLFLAALAQISIAIPGSPVPVTGQTLGVLLLGTSYGSVLGISTFLTYLLVGFAGAPVFADGSHGLARLTGATGGYLFGMLIASFVVGALAGRKWDQKIFTAIPVMLIGDGLIFAFGCFWLHDYTNKSWSWTLSAGFTPFLLGEAIKIAIAGTSLPLVWRWAHN